MNMINAITHIKQLWEETMTVWGKACIALFYSFLFLQILGTIYSLFDTRTGWDCLWSTLDASDINFVVGTMKVANFWILGFMLYGYWGGIKVGNILMVFVFYFLQYLMYKPVFAEFMAENCPDELSTFNISMIVTIIWIALALLCSGIEIQLGGGSAGESSHLLADGN